MKQISLKTLPNGYSLSVENFDYMYFNLQDLIRGVFVHIGLEIDQYLSNDYIDEMMETSIKWNDNEKNVNEITRLTDVCKRQDSLINSRQKEILRMTNKLAAVLELVKNAIKEEDVNEKKKILQNAIRAIGKVNALTEKDKELLNTPDEEDEDEDEDE